MVMSTTHDSLSSQALTRLQGGELILKGYDNDEIADICDVSPYTVQHWRKTLDEHHSDLCSLVRKKGSGRISQLSEEQKQQLKDIILAGAVQAGYSNERWTSKMIADVIQKTFGITMAPRTVRDLLPTLGLSPQMPVVKSHKHSDEAVLQWASRTWTRIKKKRRDSACP